MHTLFDPNMTVVDQRDNDVTIERLVRLATADQLSNDLRTVHLKTSYNNTLLSDVSPICLKQEESQVMMS